MTWPTWDEFWLGVAHAARARATHKSKVWLYSEDGKTWARRRLKFVTAKRPASPAAP